MAGSETIRRAAPADAAVLARFAERCFRETFGSDNRPADMDEHCSRSYGEAQQRREIADPGVITLLLENGGELAGYAQLGWDPAPPEVGGVRPLQIRRFYVDAAWHGRGFAQLLMARTLELASEGGADRLWLGVWERNARGIAFYRKAGFETRGGQLFLVGSDPQHDLLMVRDVGRSAR